MAYTPPPPIRIPEVKTPTIFDHELVLKYEMPTYEQCVIIRKQIQSLKDHLERFPEEGYFNKFYTVQLDTYTKMYEFWIEIRTAHYRVNLGKENEADLCFK
jgi:hypothetical protein